MPNVTVGSFSLGAGPLISGDCLGWLLIICLLSHRPQSEASPRADPAKPAMNENLINKNRLYHSIFLVAGGYLRWFLECLLRLVWLSLQRKAECKDLSQWHTLIASFCLCFGWRWFTKRWLFPFSYPVQYNIYWFCGSCPDAGFDWVRTKCLTLVSVQGHTEGRHQGLQHQHGTRLWTPCQRSSSQ